MIPDKTKAVGGNQTAFIKITSKDENIVKQIAVKSNFVCGLISGSNSYFSKTKPEEIWEQSQLVNADHPYLKTKKVKPYGIRQRGNELIIPMHDCNNKLQNLQRIFPDGKKLFLPDKLTKGCFYILEAPNDSRKIYIAEGYATSASIYEATKQCVVVAFSANNLPLVAEIINWEYPNSEIIICADNDLYSSSKNIGLDKASEAAMLIDAKLVAPRFKYLYTQPKDFNDLANLEGINEVRIQLGNAKKINNISIDTKKDQNQSQDEIANRLAKLSFLEYGQVRK